LPYAGKRQTGCSPNLFGNKDVNLRFDRFWRIKLGPAPAGLGPQKKDPDKVFYIIFKQQSLSGETELSSVRTRRTIAAEKSDQTAGLPWFPNRLGEQPVWCCPQRAYLRREPTNKKKIFPNKGHTQRATKK
jgi:hypothetical protein